jgi:S1-C subfamily serine protease
VFDTETRTSSGYAFERNDRSLSLLFEAISDQTFEKLYQRFTESRGTRFVSYRVLQPSYFVSAGRFRGRPYYTWFSRADAWPVGFTLSWTESRQEISGRLTTLLANAFEPEQTPEQTASEPNPPSDPPKPEVANTSGTGFLVSDRGHIITNHHVANDCRQISVRRGTQQAVSAELVVSNPLKDLALLKATGGFGSVYAKFRAGAPVRAGEDVVVFGFPLAGALSTQGNLVPGYVTALAGLRNDANSLQISAPVQPGNSGGPLLDRAGNVVGIVQSKLDALQTAELTGDIPQNVNFAIKSQVAVDFLDWVGFRYETADSTQQLSVSDVGDKAAQFTFLIECIRN